METPDFGLKSLVFFCPIEEVLGKGLMLIKLVKLITFTDYIYRFHKIGHVLIY